MKKLLIILPEGGLAGKFKALLSDLLTSTILTTYDKQG